MKFIELGTVGWCMYTIYALGEDIERVQLKVWEVFPRHANKHRETSTHENVWDARHALKKYEEAFDCSWYTRTVGRC
jgi:hypothetical protein